MADDGKVDIKINVHIGPFGEVKGGKAPAWFEARPQIYRHIGPIPFSRSLKLDPRKWKKAAIESGAYAVARYELQNFATVLAGLDKEIAKALPKAKNFKALAKTASKEEAAALDAAAAKATKAWARLKKQIEDKVSLALDEIESDRGDNKKALAAGKDLVKRLGETDFRGVIAKPLAEAEGALKQFGASLRKGPDPAAAKKLAERLGAVRQQFAVAEKQLRAVVAALQAQLKKMAKDKDADPKLSGLAERTRKAGKLDAAIWMVADLAEYNASQVEGHLDDLKAEDATLRDVAVALAAVKDAAKVAAREIGKVEAVVKAFDKEYAAAAKAVK